VGGTDSRRGNRLERSRPCCSEAEISHAGRVWPVPPRLYPGGSHPAATYLPSLCDVKWLRNHSGDHRVNDRQRTRESIKRSMT